MKALIILALLQAPQPERWEALIELNQHRLVFEEAQALVGEEEMDGERLALAARAAAAAGQVELAERWLGLSDGAAVELERARIYLSQDKLEQALAITLSPGEPPQPKHPERADGWMLPCRALARAGELERARPMLEALVERFPHDDEAPAALHLLAQAAIARGDLEGARSWRERAQSAARWRALFDARRLQALESPGDPLPRFGLAALWLEVGEARSALKLLDALVTSSPELTRAHALRGDALRVLGELDGSLAAWSRALELDPELHAARFNRAVLFIGRERWEEAKSDLVRLVELEEAQRPPLLEAHLHLATALEALGDPEGARAARDRHAALGGKK